jgi:2,5-diamino-6-(ribosylamino)-4(3H)-pyrimidinone 5'-phosphate reductase
MIPVEELEGEWRPAEIEEQPRPVILDPCCLISLSRLSKPQETKSPWVLCGEETTNSTDSHIPLKTYDGRFRWGEILSVLSTKGLTSMVIEGGAEMINDILNQRMADVIIITIVPVLLGAGVEIPPVLHQEWLQDVRSIAVGKNLVVAGRMKSQKVETGSL